MEGIKIRSESWRKSRLWWVGWLADKRDEVRVRAFEVSEMSLHWHTSGLALRLWHIAQRMSTSRADRPAALVALLVMVLLGFFWV